MAKYVVEVKDKGYIYSFGGFSFDIPRYTEHINVACRFHSFKDAERTALKYEGKVRVYNDKR